VVKRLEWLRTGRGALASTIALVAVALLLIYLTPTAVSIILGVLAAWIVAARHGARVGTGSAIVLSAVVVYGDIRRDLATLAASVVGCLLLIASAWAAGTIADRVRRSRKQMEDTIRDLRSAQAKLAASEQRYRLLVENITDSVHVKDTSARFVMVNSETARAAGIPKDRFIGRTAVEVYGPETGRKALDDDLRVISTGEIVETEETWERDGKVSVAHVRKMPLRDAAGQVAGVVTVARDITARRNSEQEMRRLTSILDATPDFVVMMSPTGALLYANQSARACLGIIPGTTLSQMNLRNHMPEPFAKMLLTVAMPTAALHGAWAGEAAIIRHDGTRLPTSQVLLAHRTASGEVDHYSTIIRDITELKRAETMLVSTNQQLVVRTQELEESNRQASILRELGDLLQVCTNDTEAYGVLRRCASQLFPDVHGRLYLLRQSRNAMEIATEWLTSSGDHAFAPNDCWALRRGSPHMSNSGENDLTCHHVQKREHGSDLCVPMHAHGEVLGLLHLSSDSVQLSEAHQRTAEAVAEHVGLALANLHLRETLRNQAIRDALTGLFNRRYLEETLTRELSRARRNRHSVAVMMIDLDHLKLFNDRYGHEAGDVLLHEVGMVLQQNVRVEDVVCRYGGDEFAIVLPDADLQSAARRAQEIADRVKERRIEYRGRPLGESTISVGVAASPEHGDRSDELIRAADQALYAAKRAGRDRVQVAEESEEPLPKPKAGPRMVVA